MSNENNNYLTSAQMQELLTEDKRKYCEMAVENEFRPKNKRLTNIQIAEQLGYTDRQIRRWKKDPVVVQYVRYLTNSERDNFYPTVIRQLQAAIEGTSNNGAASMKAIELYLKASGMLVDQQHVIQSVEHRAPMSRKDITDEIGKLDDMMNGDK